MARASERLPENVPGDMFVDSSCIDCDTCRWLAPHTFDRSARGQSFVHAQPETKEDRERAFRALVACPTASIGTAGSKAEIKAAAAAFPEVVSGNVHYCGYAAESSFGASSYLIVRKEGNVLVDSPRAAGPLMDRIEELGGVRFMFLTHRDDVAFHEEFHARFGCERILHAADVSRGTASVERRIEGQEKVSLAPDLHVIPVPGHTRGSAVLLYTPSPGNGGAQGYLFTGDHLAGTDDGTGLEAWPGVCWYSWEEQTRSMEKLLAERFDWVLPGHGRRHHAPAEVTHERLEKLVRWMKHARSRSA